MTWESVSLSCPRETTGVCTLMILSTIIKYMNDIIDCSQILVM